MPVIELLRRRADGRPVYGVRLELDCPCGARFAHMLTVGVDHPAIWCPWCRQRRHIRLRWALGGDLRAGARVQLRQDRIVRKP